MDTTLDLANGTKIPQLGLGTWQATSDEEVRRSVEAALDAGYRLIDTAHVYRNEHLIGQVLNKRFSDGRLKREDIFITSKLASIYMGSKELVHRCVDFTLKSLQLDYIDLYLIHFPCGFQFKGDDNLFPFDEQGKILLDMESDFLQVWKALEEYVDSGRIKSIGVSNFNVSQMERIRTIARHPLCNIQVELNVYLQQKPLVEYCKKNNITVTAYAPLGSPGRPDAMREVQRQPSLLDDDTIVEIAAKKDKTAAQVAMKFLLQEGLALIPKSVTPSRIRENSQLFDFHLDANEMETLRAKDKNLRTFIMKRTSSHPEYPFH